MPQLPIARNVPLDQYSTMRLGGQAAYAVGVHTPQELAAAYQWASDNQLPMLVIGSGSNIVWRQSGFQGLLAVNLIKGFETRQEGEVTFVTIGAGENWDQIVARCVADGLSGIESLSLIPGTAGATPVQNVGAYGQEIANVLVHVQAYDTITGDFVTIPAADCAFGYRTSRFKAGDRGRYFITAITLRLTKTNPQPPFYNALQKYLDEHNITSYTPQTIRQAVIAIRSSKLPDPNQVANNGSFFANPIIDETVYQHIAAKHTEVPHWPATDGRVKLSAAWLVDQAGFKDFHDSETGMATWAKQPLVLVNEHASTSDDLLLFKKKIVDAVHQQFNIVLEQEPELLPIV
jgi:UDP-N-acetylmuramate dehydrogenase